MYTVYTDEYLLHAPNLVEDSCVIYDAKITMEMNRAGSFTFKVPPTNPAYNSMKKLKSLITVKKDGKEIWRGRILNDRKDFFKNKEVYCEGELAFLNDALMAKYDYSKTNTTVSDFAKKVIDKYNNSVSDYRKIYLGNITAIDGATKFKGKSEEYSNCFTEFVDNLVDYFGVGYIDLRRSNDKTYIDWLTSEDKFLGSEIRFGENLLDLDESIDATEVYTHILPVGKQQDNGSRVQINSVNNGVNYLESESGINTFGRIGRVVTYDDIDDPAELKKAAQKDLDNAIKMAATITVSAIDLNLLDVRAERIKIGYQVPVISVPHGINNNFLCVKIVMDLLQPEQSEYTLGFYTDALTDKQIRNAKNMYSASKVYNAFMAETNQTLKGLMDRVAALEKG